MAKAAQKKLVLTQPRTIPLEKLERSSANVRKVKKGMTIADLADDIGYRGLLENLGARPIYDEAGNETDRFHVTYGGRRLEALLLLVERKRLAKDAPIPCMVRTEGVAEDDSLSENELRVGLHPLDQFRAFERLAELEFTDEDIAARHFVSLQVVQQRRRLARVSPRLLAAYETDLMTLGQLQAFTLTEDHARQEAVWEAIVGRYEGSNAVSVIRRALTETSIRVTDYRVRFIGLTAYEAAGGHVRRDLFEQDQGGWIDDVALVERLAMDKLNAAAEPVAAEGWKWVDVVFDLPYGTEYEHRQLEGEAPAITAEQEERYAALETELDTLREIHGRLDHAPEEIRARVGEIVAEIDAMDSLPLVYDPAEKAIAGTFVSVDAAGRISIERGYVREEDEPVDDTATAAGDAQDQADRAGDIPAPSAPIRAIVTIGGEPVVPAPDQPEDVETDKPLSDTLITELTEVRTVALQNAVASNPDVAMTLLLHKLCRASRRHGYSTSCLEATVIETRFMTHNQELKHTPAAAAMEQRRAAWNALLPEDDAALWAYLDMLDAGSRAELLAHLLSLGVTAVDERPKYDNGRTGPDMMRRRIADADRVARSVGLDMVAEAWQPTADNYLNRVTKPRILDAVREGMGEHTAQLIAHLKKGDMAREAERLLSGSGWLPELLRLVPIEQPAVPVGEKEDELPDFLDDAGVEPVEDLAEGDAEFLDAAE